MSTIKGLTIFSGINNTDLQTANPPRSVASVPNASEGDVLQDIFVLSGPTGGNAVGAPGSSGASAFSKHIIEGGNAVQTLIADLSQVMFIALVATP